MPKIAKEQATELLEFIEEHVPHERFHLVIAKFGEVANKYLAGEDAKTQEEIIKDFITKLNAQRSSLQMQIVFGIAGIAKRKFTGEKEKAAQLQQIIDFGGAIWGTGLFGVNVWKQFF